MNKTGGFIFKARRRDSNEWVFGCLLGDSTIIPTGQEFEIEGGTIYGYNFEAVDVIPSTVVPLFDKNETNTAVNEYNIAYGGKGMITCSECQYSNFGANDYVYCRRCRRTVNECFFCASGCRKKQQEREKTKETEC